MKKRFWYPIWKIEEIENELVNLEKDGWRLNKISGIRCFEFTKSTQKTVNYFFIYNIVREKPTMYSIEDTLKRDFNGNRIEGCLMGIIGIAKFFRISNQVDLTKEKVKRNTILLRLILKRIILGISLFILMLFPFVLATILKPDSHLLTHLLNIMPPVCIVFFLGYFSLCLGSMIYNTIGYIYLKKKISSDKKTS